MIATANKPDKRAHVLGLMPKQYSFVHDDNHVELLYSGAFGAGKSRALCCRAYRKALPKGARVGLFRKTLASLKATTVVTLLEADGENPPILVPGTYSYHIADSRIRLNTGGEIVLLGCDNELRIGSTPLSDVCIDEAIELDEAEYTMLLGRIRVQYGHNLNSIASVTNPGAPEHWLHKRFYEKPLHHKRRLIEANASENYHLPQNYLELLSELTGSSRARYFMGEWVAMEGAIYWMYDAAKLHVRHDTGPFDYYVAGVDCGINNPNVIRVHGCKYGHRRSHVVSEFYERHVMSPHFVGVCQATASLFNPITFVVDPSAADVIQQLRHANLSVRPADNDVLAGIRCVQQSLNVGDNGDEPKLTMEPSCAQGNREYSSYRWKKNVTGEAERPVKEADHALDADRYARMFIMAGRGEPMSMMFMNRRGVGKKQSDDWNQHVRDQSERPLDPMSPEFWPSTKGR